MSRLLDISAAAVSAIVFTTVAASAAVQQTSTLDLVPNDNPNAGFAFAASSADLINTGSATLVSVTGADGVSAAPAQSPAVNDGTLGLYRDATDPAEYMSYDASIYTVRYNLNVASNPLGYDIQDITLFSAGTIYRTNQLFGISFELVDGSTVDLGLFSKTIVVDSAPAGDAEGQSFVYGGIRTTINDSTSALLASGVKSILFGIRPDYSSLPGTDLGTRYREFDVTGSATVPEPSALGLLGGAALMALRRRRAC